MTTVNFSSRTEIGMEDDHTVVLRIVFKDAYSAIQVHDRLIDGRWDKVKFSLAAVHAVNMERAQHPIESFPCKLDPPADIWKSAYVGLWLGLMIGATLC